MKLDELYQACERFEKLAQQPQARPKAKPDPRVVLDPKKSNLNFWSKLLYNAIGSYSLLLSSPAAAQTLFNNIATYRRAPAYGGDKPVRDIDAIHQALKEAEERVRQAGKDPIEILKRQGMQNVNPNILNILRSNLEILSAAQDFSKYQHYYLPRPGEAKDVIELDKEEDKTGY